MPSEPGAQSRAVGVWGARAYAWSGEERPRAAGFPIDLSGRQRALGFPAAGGRGTSPRRARALPEKGRRVRLVVGVVAVLGWRSPRPARAGRHQIRMARPTVRSAPNAS